MKGLLARKNLGIPYAIFMVIFVVIPLLVLVYYAFTDGTGRFTLDNLICFFTSPNTIGTLFYSFIMSVISTIIALLIAYPVAYILAKNKLRLKSAIVMILVLPMWINFTLRLTALKELLDTIEGNLASFRYLNTVIGIVYSFLPMVILPIYTTLTKVNGSMIEAAQDLGASRLQVFMKVVFPLSIPGVVSGIMMILLPSMTNYVILDMMYNSTYNMGSLIGGYFLISDWNNGAMTALVLLVMILIVSVLTGRDSDTDMDSRGGALL